MIALALILVGAPVADIPPDARRYDRDDMKLAYLCGLLRHRIVANPSDFPDLARDCQSLGLAPDRPPR